MALLRWLSFHVLRSWPSQHNAASGLCFSLFKKAEIPLPPFPFLFFLWLCPCAQGEQIGYKFSASPRVQTCSTAQWPMERQQCALLWPDTRSHSSTAGARFRSTCIRLALLSSYDLTPLLIANTEPTSEAVRDSRRKDAENKQGRASFHQREVGRQPEDQHHSLQRRAALELNSVCSNPVECRLPPHHLYTTGPTPIPLFTCDHTTFAT